MAKVFDFLLIFPEINSAILKTAIRAIIKNAGYIKIDIKTLIFLGIISSQMGEMSKAPNPRPE